MTIDQIADDLIEQIAGHVVQEQARNVEGMRAAGLDADVIATADAFAAEYHERLLIDVRTKIAEIIFQSS